MLGTFVALLAVAANVNADSISACDATFVYIKNQTDIEFYQKCDNLTESGKVFIDHTFNGPFDLPHIDIIPNLSSGYYFTPINGYSKDSPEDGVTSVSMPDLTNITASGLFFGYVNNLTSISFPKLKSVTGGLVVNGNSNLNRISFPSLATVQGGIVLDGDWDKIDMPMLTSASYIKISTNTRNISCPDLGKAWANVSFVPFGSDDWYKGFTCSALPLDNRWNSSDPTHGADKTPDDHSDGNSNSKSGHESSGDTESMVPITRYLFGPRIPVVAYSLTPSRPVATSFYITILLVLRHVVL